MWRKSEREYSLVFGWVHWMITQQQCHIGLREINELFKGISLFSYLQRWTKVLREMKPCLCKTMNNCVEHLDHNLWRGFGVYPAQYWQWTPMYVQILSCFDGIDAQNKWRKIHGSSCFQKVPNFLFMLDFQLKLNYAKCKKTWSNFLATIPQ